MIYEPLPGETLPDLEYNIVDEILESDCSEMIENCIAALNDPELSPYFAQQIKLFLSIYTTFIDGEYCVNQEAIVRLRDFLWHHISVIQQKDIIKAVEASLKDVNPGETAYFYIKYDSHCLYEMLGRVDSNIYILRLIKQLAKQRGIKIRVVNIDSRLKEDAVIRYVDDVAYTGAQMEGEIESIDEVLGKVSKVKIFLAGSTEYARDKFRNMPFKRDLKLELETIIDVPSLDQIIYENPEVRAFFEAKLISGSYFASWGDHYDDLNEHILESFYFYLANITLTRTTFRIPDQQSFPSELKLGFNNTFRNRAYPRSES